MHQLPVNGKFDVLWVDLQSVWHVSDESGGVAVPYAGRVNWVGSDASDDAPLCLSRGVAQPGRALMDAHPHDPTIAELVISAVVPTFLAGETSEITALPMLDLGALTRDGSMVYEIATLEGGGRVSERLISRLLEWQPGQSLDFSRIEDVIVVQGHPSGAFRVPGSALVAIPAAMRHWCRLSPGDRVLLAAAPRQGVLLIHTMAALDRMVVRYDASLAESAQQ